MAPKKLTETEKCTILHLYAERQRVFIWSEHKKAIRMKKAEMWHEIQEECIRRNIALADDMEKLQKAMRDWKYNYKVSNDINRY